MDVKQVCEHVNSLPYKNYREFFGDIFEYFEDARKVYSPIYLVQTISSDLAMDAGIAKKINDIYDFKDSYLTNLANMNGNYVPIGTEWFYNRRTHTHYNKETDTIINRYGLSLGEIVTCEDVPFILAVTTKFNHYDKPTLETMRTALRNLSSYLYTKHIWCGDEEVKVNLVMPTIGCGLDRLNFNDVRQIILEELVKDWCCVTVVMKEEQLC